MRRLDRRTGRVKGEGGGGGGRGRKMWEGTYRVIDLSRGCAERSTKGERHIQYCA